MILMSKSHRKDSPIWRYIFWKYIVYPIPRHFLVCYNDTRQIREMKVRNRQQCRKVLTWKIQDNIVTLFGWNIDSKKVGHCKSIFGKNSKAEYLRLILVSEELFKKLDHHWNPQKFYFSIKNDTKLATCINNKKILSFCIRHVAFMLKIIVS